MVQVSPSSGSSPLISPSQRQYAGSRGMIISRDWRDYVLGLLAITILWMGYSTFVASKFFDEELKTTTTNVLSSSQQLGTSILLSKTVKEASPSTTIPPPPTSKRRKRGYKLLPATQKEDESKQLQAQKEWPPLSKIYDGKQIIANPQFLLDFAIIGFEKSGSSTFMKWLGAHPQIQCFQDEIYDIYQNKPGALVWRLYTQLQPGYDTLRGYKSPGDVFLANAIHLLDDYFPKTRLILALRHPVHYYQSIYNFRIQNLDHPDDPFQTPLEGIGECSNKYPGFVCTNHANYAQYMYRLGKTLSKYPTPTELEIINEKPQSAAKARITRNLIFVVEMNQLKDTNVERKQQLKDDLRDFLGLSEDLPDPPKVVPGKKWSADVQAIKDRRKMNICEPQYVPLRKELMRVSRITATWILESFVHSDDVFTSSPDYFAECIQKWMEDPCEEETTVQNVVKR